MVSSSPSSPHSWHPPPLVSGASLGGSKCFVSRGMLCRNFLLPKRTTCYSELSRSATPLTVHVSCRQLMYEWRGVEVGRLCLYWCSESFQALSVIEPAKESFQQLTVAQQVVLLVRTCAKGSSSPGWLVGRLLDGCWTVGRPQDASSQRRM